ncbi:MULTISPECIES: bifunctional glutamate--cysteine ligase GshA/glutathione synthetase GshB [Lactobacillaceae]|uniref:Glutathione biosynthesis bifunctional protein GshAB n=5 Tax=Lactobacillaceae TaxID=33958 RepID=A0A0R1Q0R9_9LACO|nr:bifunctional glutamate--cysteine ligase glutathione synthetase [Liquorilactobacillus uvarum DSM 19971]KRO10050.1 bifunctional glutamate--cysteine ligase glutathione synthetase [Paucilactobacillus hokkaidonensis]BAP86368.1 glutathione biosynthesis bifunctional protein GshF [Paucilactobacillus hokkaidonensis JCM 18461]
MIIFSELLQQTPSVSAISHSRIGVERESQRVTLDGKLAGTDHPIVFGSRRFHPYIKTDFAETQLEIVTPVVDTVNDLFHWLAALHDVVYQSLPTNEMLWPLSMPPALPSCEDQISLAKLPDFKDVLYRRYLAKTYGRRKQMISGLHFNFELPAVLVEALYRQQCEIKDLACFKTTLYLKIARNYLHYRWVITYLFGASPVAERNYFKHHEEKPQKIVRSIRNSEFGYRNKENVQVSFESLKIYLSDIESQIRKGNLLEEKEFYSSVRLRESQNIVRCKQTKIDYLELRNIDINPFERYGISKNQIVFMELFMLFMLWTDEKKNGDDWIATGNQTNNEVALESPLAPTCYRTNGLKIINLMKKMTKQLNLNGYEEVLQQSQDMLIDVTKTIGGRMTKGLMATKQSDLATAIGLKNRRVTMQVPYQLNGFVNMELSTQILMFDAIQKGIMVDMVDENDQLLKLQLGHQIEYVKNGNMTSRDSYIVPLIMKNKTATKRILVTAGFNVPIGVEFVNADTALAAYSRFVGEPIVIKPQSANYGRGVSVFQFSPSLADYQQAIRRAFTECSTVLVENFFAGPEYRFLVINDKIKAVLLRIPANVIGDGHHTVKQLVAIKNKSTLRGLNDRTPLTKISLGVVEQAMLKSQSLTVDSIPVVGKRTYLRKNSNISSGGDSIDVTDQIDFTYKEKAVAAVKCLGAKICGIDLIIPDRLVPVSSHESYSIIEANYNPMMDMHCYPYKGKKRRVTVDVLEFLFPQLTNL